MSILSEGVQLGQVLDAAVGPGTYLSGSGLSGDLSMDDFSLVAILPATLDLSQG